MGSLSVGLYGGLSEKLCSQGPTVSLSGALATSLDSVAPALISWFQLSLSLSLSLCVCVCVCV